MANEPDPAPAAPTEVPVAAIDHDNSALEDYVEQNKTKLILIVGAVLLAVIAYLLFTFNKESGKSTAAAALTGAETVEELREVVKEYPNSVVAGSAELFIAEKLDEEEKAEESYNTLKAFVASRSGHPFYLKGVSDLGLKEHVMGNLDKAVELLKQASAPGEAPAYIEQPALLRLGDALIAQGIAAMESDKESEAKALFEEATTVLTRLEEAGEEARFYKAAATKRKERIPHLTIKPLSPEAAKAAAAASVVSEPVVTPEGEAAEGAAPAEAEVVVPDGN